MDRKLQADLAAAQTWGNALKNLSVSLANYSGSVDQLRHNLSGMADPEEGLCPVQFTDSLTRRFSDHELNGPYTICGHEVRFLIGQSAGSTGPTAHMQISPINK